MGKRSREHRQAVIAGTEKPFRTSPDKPKPELPSKEELMGLAKASEVAGIAERAKVLKEKLGG